jgi:PhoPQ-activated pathogenicity-related protein
MRRLLLLAFAALLLPAPARADLDAYLKKPEPAYRWEKKGEQVIDGCRVYDLQLVSQTWQGLTWEHRLQVFRPEKLEFPDFCTLYNTGGGGSDGTTRMGVGLAKSSGAVYAILHHIPNQPIYGKTEDALVVHTWLKYLQTGDESWPLHFPMAKACLKAMDSIQALAKQEGQPEIKRFMVHGASKRGWTTYLVGASKDPRVVAIAPMVIDVLNVVKQTEHQKESYGELSEQVGDYTSAGVVEKLKTPAGRRLLELEDPYSYRDRLTMPKLLILGTNDRYWSQDSLNLYWDDLKGPKWVLYVPNSGHGLEDRERVYNTLSAFVRSIAGRKPWPRLEWAYTPTDSGADLRLKSDIRPKEARLFRTTSKTRDFRTSRWAFEPMQSNSPAYLGRAAKPEEGYAATFGEAVYEIDGRPFTLSTQIRILGGKQ